MKLGITMLIHNKDDIQFVTEYPCFLGHPVYIDWSVRSAQYTTETGLPLITNTDLKFVFNLNID